LIELKHNYAEMGMLFFTEAQVALLNHFTLGKSERNTGKECEEMEAKNIYMCPYFA
jgi:hypothetical protein